MILLPLGGLLKIIRPFRILIWNIAHPFILHHLFVPSTVLPCLRVSASLLQMLKRVVCWRHIFITSCNSARGKKDRTVIVIPKTLCPVVIAMHSYLCGCKVSHGALCILGELFLWQMSVYISDPLKQLSGMVSLVTHWSSSLGGVV